MSFEEIVDAEIWGWTFERKHLSVQFISDICLISFGCPFDPFPISVFWLEIVFFFRLAEVPLQISVEGCEKTTVSATRFIRIRDPFHSDV